MKGDFSKITFAPDKNFLRVLMQQGRVQLDADWNEQTAILLHYMQTLATDLIGPYAGPQGANLGFTLTSVGEFQSEFLIGKGRYYVDGILCENHYDTRYFTQPDYPLDPYADALPQGYSLVYLDVWERHISYVEDDAIREKALNGVDTATRSKVVWQVKVKPLEFKHDWAGVVDGMRKELVLSQACLSARVNPGDPKADPCCLSPDAKFRGSENQLYRIEIHHPGDGGSVPPTFKWSRENGSVVFPVSNLVIDEAGNTLTVTLETLGRDDKLGLSVNDWVELVDDATVLRNICNPLCQVYSIDAMAGTVVLKGEKPVVYDQSRHPLLRRWDQKGDGHGIKIETSKWLPIESGIEVEFSIDKAPLRTGDYWLIPARVSTGNVEWPVKRYSDGTVIKDEAGNTAPAFLRPFGVEHHFAPLATIFVSGVDVFVADYRCSFRPLTYSCYYSYYGRFGQGIGTDLLCPDEAKA